MSIQDLDGIPELTIHGKVATITLKKSEYANCLNVNDLNKISEYVKEVNANPAILVLKFMAEGKYFCSGFDLKALSGENSPSSLIFGQTVDLIEGARPITVAVIQGGLYGGGTDLAIACDFRVGSENVNMFIPAAKLGLHFYPGGLRRYVARVGLNKAKEIFLLAKHFYAKDLFDMGYLTHLVSHEDLYITANNLIENLIKMSPLALCSVKKHLNLIANNDYRELEIIESVKKSESSNDIKEGVLAWKEKRSPNFNGT